jgi:hypothetical protein
MFYPAWQLFQAQITGGDDMFAIIDIVFASLFATELLVNIAAHFFTPFIRDPWNWFDMVSPPPPPCLPHPELHPPPFSKIHVLHFIRSSSLLTNGSDYTTNHPPLHQHLT